MTRAGIRGRYHLLRLSYALDRPGGPLDQTLQCDQTLWSAGKFFLKPTPEREFVESSLVINESEWTRRLVLLQLAAQADCGMNQVGIIT